MLQSINRLLPSDPPIVDAFHESHGSCSKESSVGLCRWVRLRIRVRVSWSTEDCVRELVVKNGDYSRYADLSWLIQHQ